MPTADEILRQYRIRAAEKKLLDALRDWHRYLSEHGAAPRTRGVRSSRLLASSRSEPATGGETGGQPGVAPASESSRGNAKSEALT